MACFKGNISCVYCIHMNRLYCIHTYILRRGENELKRSTSSGWHLALNVATNQVSYMY